MTESHANRRFVFSADDVLNDLSSKALLVNYLNEKGRFWEYCNHASETIPDDQLIMKSLLSLEFEESTLSEKENTLK